MSWVDIKKASNSHMLFKGETYSIRAEMSPKNVKIFTDSQKKLIKSNYILEYLNGHKLIKNLQHKVQY